MLFTKRNIKFIYINNATNNATKKSSTIMLFKKYTLHMIFVSQIIGP